jgi:hypothetical protein
LDTGSGITIFNPSKGYTDGTDGSFGVFRVLGECAVRIQSFAGEMLARRRVGVRVGWGAGDTTETEGVVLTGHTQGFPRVLLGRRILLVDMKGMKMKWDARGKAVRVEFGRWPGRVEGVPTGKGIQWRNVRCASRKRRNSAWSWTRIRKEK